MQLIIGQIARPHGVRGEVIVAVRTDEPESRFVAGTVLDTDPAAAGPLTLAEFRWHQGRLIAAFDGYADRDAAERLRGVLLCVDSRDVPAPADPDEFHDHQLVGLTAVDTAGERLGEVTGIDHAPAADLLLLRRPDGRTARVPFVKAIVPEVDLAAGRVVVDPPGGLLDL